MWIVLYIYIANIKALNQLCTAQLICGFVFVYAKIRFSQYAAQGIMSLIARNPVAKVTVKYVTKRPAQPRRRSIDNLEFGYIKWRLRP